MSQTQSTRCPHCQTAFRVTAEQLAAAKGAVRCGSCLQVFNATEYLLETTPRKPRNRPAEQLSRRPESSTDDNPQASRWEASPEAPEDAATFERDDDLLFNADDDDDVLFMDDDEYDLADDNDDTEAESSSLEFSDSFLSLDDASDTSPAHTEDTEPDKAAPSADDSWALEMLASMEKEDAGAQPTRHQDMSLTDLETDSDPFGDRPVSTSPRRRSSHSEQLEAAFANQDLDEMADQMEASASRRWPWRAGAVVLAILLLAQIGWWERQRLSQQPGLDTVYQTVCNLIGCDLPETAPDAGSIRALSSVLRPLPDGRMRLDAVFVNRGDRPSPFPMLKLTIEDFQGNTLADGLFAPEDYVGGELRPNDLMPPGRPVSISMNLERPVEDLNNFRLTFHY